MVAVTSPPGLKMWRLMIKEPCAGSRVAGGEHPHVVPKGAQPTGHDVSSQAGETQGAPAGNTFQRHAQSPKLTTVSARASLNRKSAAHTRKMDLALFMRPPGGACVRSIPARGAL